jgi:hypothetical protein
MLLFYSSTNGVTYIKKTFKVACMPDVLEVSNWLIDNVTNIRTLNYTLSTTTFNVWLIKYILIEGKWAIYM